MKLAVHDIVTIAQRRSQTYDMLIGIFMTLPDESFLKVLFSDETFHFFSRYRQVNHPSLTKGIDLIFSFLEKNKNAVSFEGKDRPHQLIEALAVDRTKLIRAPYQGSLRAPYENQYRKGLKSSNLQLNLKRIYQDSGYIPVHSGDTMDFFSIQLDFIRVLILKMLAQPDSLKELIHLQNQFMSDHIISWIKEYTQAAVSHAETDFYKGCLYFLEGFLDLESGYLKELDQDR